MPPHVFPFLQIFFHLKLPTLEGKPDFFSMVSLAVSSSSSSRPIGSVSPPSHFRRMLLAPVDDPFAGSVNHMLVVGAEKSRQLSEVPLLTTLHTEASGRL